MTPARHRLVIRCDIAYSCSTLLEVLTEARGRVRGLESLNQPWRETVPQMPHVHVFCLQTG